MLRCTCIGVVITLATLAAAPAGQAQTSLFGLFRENNTSLPYSQRNCWVQGMVSGQTINGELLASNLTQQQAQCELRRYTRHALCARDRITGSWSSRQETGLDGTGSSVTRLDCSDHDRTAGG